MSSRSICSLKARKRNFSKSDRLRAGPVTIQELRARLAPHPPKPPTLSTSKAGRDLAKAVPTAIVALALVAVSVLWHVELFVALIAVALLIGLWEAAGAFMVKGIRIPLVPAGIGTVAMVASTWIWGLPAGFLVFMATAAAAYFWRVHDGSRGAPRDAVAGIFALGWISLLGCFAVALSGLDDAPWLIALLVLLPVASDTGGWMAGVLFGKHPMAPTISPKKSWEGFAGSIALAIVAALLILTLLLGRPWHVATLFAVLAVVSGTLGDLSESLLKRDVGVKDMGSLFPGHGGMLDRIDSILMWAPLCYLLAVHAAGF